MTTVPGSAALHPAGPEQAVTSEQRERLDDATRNGPHKFGCNALFYGQPTTACTCGRRQRQDDIRALLAAHDALQAQLAEARAERDRLHDQWYAEAQRLQQAERERAEAVQWIGVVREELVCAGGASGDRAVALANLRALIAARDEARAEVERLADDVRAHTAVGEELVGKWRREKERAVQAERAAAHWQAEHGRLRARIADTAYAITFQTLGQYRSALLASSTPAPTGDGPQTGAMPSGERRYSDMSEWLNPDTGPRPQTPASGEGEGRS